MRLRLPGELNGLLLTPEVSLSLPGIGRRRLGFGLRFVGGLACWRGDIGCLARYGTKTQSAVSEGDFEDTQ